MARSGRRRSPRRVTDEELARRFGATVAGARRERGWTQEDLAERLGISVSHVSLLERGARMPSYPMVVRVSDALGFSLDAATGRTQARRDDAMLAAAARLTPSMRAHIVTLMDGLARNTDVTPPPRRRRRRAKG